MTPPTDLELLQRTSRGDRDAFGRLVERHQSLVSSVAYSVVGDFSRSEDVAQEAFLAAWRQLPQLRDAAKFVPWLCSIARNLALAAARRERKSQSLDAAGNAAGGDPSPDALVAAREEEQIVWRSLEALPESYRLPLVMYYRGSQSVAEIARALEVSEDVVKQRLARGRQMLRDEVAAVVENALRRSAPGRAFTLAVLAALPGMVAATAEAATLSAAGKAAATAKTGSAVAGGAASAWLGALGGLLGAAVGFWAADQQARYQRERIFYRQLTRQYVAILAVFLLPFVLSSTGVWQPHRVLGPRAYAFALLGWLVGFFVALGALSWRATLRSRRIVAEESAAGGARLPTTSLQRFLSNWQGRKWTSRWRFLGLPLIDIQVSNPSTAELPESRRNAARGWLAIGDRAVGVIAVGGAAFGGIAIGGLGVGGVVVGGVGLGLISLCGVSGGMFCLGGIALGFAAVGGLALGWLASGGVAIAWQAAQGGLAVAQHFAVGGLAIAAHANDAAAQAYVAHSWFFPRAEPILQAAARLNDKPWTFVGSLAAIGLLAIGYLFVAYRRRTSDRVSSDSA